MRRKQTAIPAKEGAESIPTRILVDADVFISYLVSDELLPTPRGL